jgi:hypothetical protein
MGSRRKFKKCPKFSIEDEWIKEQEHLKIINYLKK